MNVSAYLFWAFWLVKFVYMYCSNQWQCPPVYYELSDWSTFLHMRYGNQWKYPPAYFELSDWSVGRVTCQARQIRARVAAGQLGNLNNTKCSSYYTDSVTRGWEEDMIIFKMFSYSTVTVQCTVLKSFLPKEEISLSALTFTVYTVILPFLRVFHC